MLIEKINYKFLIVLSVLSLVFYAFTNDFLIPEKKIKNSGLNLRKLKQDILEVVSDMVQNCSKNIEITAKIEQKLFNKIKDLLYEDKNSSLLKLSKQELKLLLEDLIKFKTRQISENKENIKLLSFLDK